MGQLSIRRIDDVRLDRLRVHAKVSKTSLEALAREAIHAASDRLVADRKELAREMQEWSRKARVPGSKQTLGIDLIREARDHDR